MINRKFLKIVNDNGFGIEYDLVKEELFLNKSYITYYLFKYIKEEDWVLKISKNGKHQIQIGPMLLNIDDGSLYLNINPKTSVKLDWKIELTLKSKDKLKNLDKYFKNIN